MVSTTEWDGSHNQLVPVLIMRKSYLLRAKSQRFIFLFGVGGDYLKGILFYLLSRFQKIPEFSGSQKYGKKEESENQEN